MSKQFDAEVNSLLTEFGPIVGAASLGSGRFCQWSKQFDAEVKLLLTEFGPIVGAASLGSGRFCQWLTWANFIGKPYNEITVEEALLCQQEGAKETKALSRQQKGAKYSFFEPYFEINKQLLEMFTSLLRKNGKVIISVNDPEVQKILEKSDAPLNITDVPALRIKASATLVSIDIQQPDSSFINMFQSELHQRT